MSIIPSNKIKIIFNKHIPHNKKKEIYDKVYAKIIELKVSSLYDIKYNHSYEGGFELPKTFNWINYLNNHQNNYIRNIHNYQPTRQLRFDINSDDNIIGAYCKDGITIFTDDELDTICSLVNEIEL
jgi:hypothetical protein